MNNTKEIIEINNNFKNDLNILFKETTKLIKLNNIFDGRISSTNINLNDNYLREWYKRTFKKLNLLQKAREEISCNNYGILYKRNGSIFSIIGLKILQEINLKIFDITKEDDDKIINCLIDTIMVKCPIKK